MTTISHIGRPLLALAAALVAAKLVADEQLTVTGQPLYQERVSFADLDLRNSSAQQTLRRRVDNASERVCRDAYGPFTDTDFVPSGSINAGMTCASMTYDDARPQIRVAIARAKAGLQLATSLVVSGPARTR